MDTQRPDRELFYLSIADASRLIAAKELSPIELLDAVLERIHETDGTINSYVRLTRRSARREAEASEERARA